MGIYSKSAEANPKNNYMTNKFDKSGKHRRADCYVVHFVFSKWLGSRMVRTANILNHYEAVVAICTNPPRTHSLRISAAGYYNASSMKKVSDIPGNTITMFLVFVGGQRKAPIGFPYH